MLMTISNIQITVSILTYPTLVYLQHYGTLLKSAFYLMGFFLEDWGHKCLLCYNKFDF